MDQLSEVVDAHVPCARCEYDLYTRPNSDSCPECHLPVSVSLDPNRLLFTNRDWLRSLYRGQYFVLAASMLIGAALIWFEMQFFSFTTPFIWNCPGWNKWVILIAILLNAAMACHAICIHFATRPAPDRRDCLTAERIRRIVRWCALAQMVAIIWPMVGVIRGSETAALALIATAAFSFALTTLACLWYIASRLMQVPLRRRAIVVRGLVAIALSFMLVFLGTWIRLTHNSTHFSGTSFMLDVPANCAGNAALSASIAIAICLHSIRRSLHMQALS